MRNVVGTFAFVIVGSATFRLLYGPFPTQDVDFLAWLIADANARASLAGGLLGGFVATWLVRSRRSLAIGDDADPRIAEAKALARSGLALHQEKRLTDAAGMFTRAIDLYADAAREMDAAPVYASLGKLYYDFDQLDLAEANLQRAVNLFGQWPSAREELDAIALLLDGIWSKRRVLKAAMEHVDSLYGFSLTIPAGWAPQQLAQEFITTGGRVAFSHHTHAATINVSIGPLIEQNLYLRDARAVAVRAHLLKTTIDRTSDVASALGPVGGEANAVTAEYDTRHLIGSAYRQRRNGFASVVRNHLEYVFQWSAESQHEAETRGILASFAFDAGERGSGARV
jgi:tetratricopeptide (TPR) repeat protein